MNALKIFVDTYKRSLRDSYIFKSYAYFFFFFFSCFASCLKCLLQPHLSFLSAKVNFFKWAIGVNILGPDTLCIACLKSILFSPLYIYTLICVYVGMHVYVCVYTYMCICVSYMDKNVHIHMLTHMHLNRVFGFFSVTS